MSAILVNFDNFESYEDKFNFLTNVLIEELKYTDKKHSQNPYDRDINFHIILLVKTLNKPYLLHELATIITGFVTISQFAKVFGNVI